MVVGVQDDGRILVPNGQTLTPAGTHIEVNDRPLGMVVSPNGALLAVVTGSHFNPRALHLIDVNTRTLRQTIPVANSFVGVAFSPASDTIYVGGGASNDVKIFEAASNGSFAANGPMDRRCYVTTGEGRYRVRPISLTGCSRSSSIGEPASPSAGPCRRSIP